ncbi:Hypothetical_protein [Hexamita inflata]|uniref:Hypothetical_protein n=1 Tax=Hexamita inflata TaxID=28002 RepID=A0AA86Q230_9EUKA|nr:Hypothetical protein HINF_LOCUS35828 [Hexamita inflata]
MFTPSSKPIVGHSMKNYREDSLWSEKEQDMWVKALVQVGYSYTRLAKISDLMGGSKSVGQIRTYMERLVFVLSTDNDPADIKEKDAQKILDDLVKPIAQSTFKALKQKPLIKERNQEHYKNVAKAFCVGVKKLQKMCRDNETIVKILIAEFLAVNYDICVTLQLVELQ